MENFNEDDINDYLPNYSFNNTNVSTDSYDINDNDDNSSNLSQDTNNPETEKLIHSCPICRENYNQNSRCAYVIFPCGHSFYKSCINKINLCAICRKPIENTAINGSLQSKVSNESGEDEVEMINPLYNVFIKLKDKIELMYLKYPNADERQFISVEQKKIINEVLLGLRNVNVGEVDINQLLIPDWLKDGINDLGNFERK